MICLGLGFGYVILHRFPCVVTVWYPCHLIILESSPFSQGDDWMCLLVPHSRSFINKVGVVTVIGVVKRRCSLNEGSQRGVNDVLDPAMRGVSSLSRQENEPFYYEGSLSY